MGEDNDRMEDDVTIDLYCHEDPLVSTPPSSTPSAASGSSDAVVGDHHQQAVQDLDQEEERLIMAGYMTRQRCYAPSRGYLDSLRLSSASSLPDGLSYARSRGLHYIVYAFGRLGLAAATAFNAVNYLDRFLAINCHLQRWETWMVELLSLACLSVACKLDEVNIPSLHHLQMEEVMSHSFRPATLRDMELTLLKALQWRVASVTPFSFLELLITCTAAEAAVASGCTRLLIRSLSETSLLRFDPSVIASSAFRCVVLQERGNVSGHISSFLTRPECPLATAMEQDKDSNACFNTMKALYASLLDWSNHQQRSPVSVIPFGISGSAVNRSAVSRCQFGRSIPHQGSTEDEDSIQPDTQEMK